ncbi:MAG: S-layer homology domain-containing protein [Oscillospiraceae bacterium]|jgi:spore germination protein YaaH|nr:S-layer homology domain-containing protein [Oscillospiraceae bacterium]
MKKRIFSICASALLIAGLAPGAGAFDALTYLYGSTTSVYLNRFAKTGGSLNVVSPDYFECAADGSVIYTKMPDSLLISSMRGRGVRVTPFLSNHWNRDNARAMLARRREAAEFIGNAVRQYGLDGIDVDIQNIQPQDKETFIDFMRLLKTALPDGADLTVCVAPNPYYTNLGWQGAYDYQKLGEICNHVFMMTYDESYDGGNPGPVSSYWFVETSIKYGLQYVPPEKLMMGLPFYGRYWTEGVKGAAWTIADIEWLVANTDSDTWYDEAKQCARATIRIPEGTTVTTWGGKKVKAGAYDVWYENERSFEKKFALVRQYGLKGLGTWALGQEPSYMWENFTQWLEGSIFDDIKNHWAQSYIITLTQEGIIKGAGARAFNPSGTLTRAETAAMFVRLAKIDTPGVENPFFDTQNHWARDEISAAHAAELVGGRGEGYFAPDEPVTREELAIIAARYTNLEAAMNLTDSPFSDVSKELTPIGNDAILKLAANGVLNGYADGTFRPHSKVTRAEAAKVLLLVRGLPTRFINGEIIPERQEQQGPR